MEYTSEQITQDTKIINWLIHKKIKNLGLMFLADDMRQVAHIKLWELRRDNNWKSGSYAIACAYYTMLNVWRKNKKHCEPQSLDCVVFENITRLEKTKASRISNDDYLYGGEIRKIIKQIQSRYSVRNQKIIEMFLLEYKQREIAETVNLSQSYVNQSIREFKQELANQLGINYRGCK